MSIPSLMTPSVPLSPHHLPHPGYSHSSSSLGSYNATDHSLPHGISTRLAPSQSFPQPHSANRQSIFNSSRQLPPPRNMPSSDTSSQTVQQQQQQQQPPSQHASSQQQQRKHPDWNEFYRNGPPKEIIVIDDDSPAPQSSSTAAGKLRRASGQNKPTPQARAGAQQPAAKKRRTAQTTAYESANDYAASQATASRPYSEIENSNTISTDRTTDPRTTAPTSNSSHGSSNNPYVDDVTIGQKRKRVTRQQIATEKRRQDANAVEEYIPPRKPPYKAKDVNVPTLRDVSTLTAASWRLEC